MFLYINIELVKRPKSLYDYFFIFLDNEKPNSSNIQGLVMCCPCSEVHREATKEFLSLINNFTDLHATSYLDLRLCQENSIPTLVEQLYNRVGWIVIIESLNFYYHSKEKDLKASHLCNLMAYFSIQLLKYSLKVKSKNRKTIYRISFDLTFEEFELSQVFPELKGHVYDLLMQKTSFGLCLNFDEIEKFFGILTHEQLGMSEKNTRRWTKNNWKESSEAKNLEKALVNRTDEMQNSTGCYFVDEKYFSAKKFLGNSHLKTNHLFYWNQEKFDKEEIEKYSETEKESGSIKTFGNTFSFIKPDLLTDNQSLINQFPYFGNSQSVSSDISSDRISLELQQINFETDAKIKNNLLKVIEEQFDELEQLSV